VVLFVASEFLTLVGIGQADHTVAVGFLGRLAERFPLGDLGVAFDGFGAQLPFQFRRGTLRLVGVARGLASTAAEIIAARRTPGFSIRAGGKDRERG